MILVMIVVKYKATTNSLTLTKANKILPTPLKLAKLQAKSQFGTPEGFHMEPSSHNLLFFTTRYNVAYKLHCFFMFPVFMLS